MGDALTYTPRERKFVMWSAILGYAFDFYNLIVVAFLLVPIQKSLNVTLTQTGLIVGMTLASSVLGGIGFRLARRQDRPQECAAVDAAAARHRLDPVGGGWDFVSLLAFRIITGIGVGGEWGAGMVLLNEVWDQQEARPRQRHRAGDVVGRHGDGVDRRDAGADLFRSPTPHGASRSASAGCRCC